MDWGALVLMVGSREINEVPDCDEDMGRITATKPIVLWGDRLTRWGISCVFFYAGIKKFQDLHHFASEIDAYGILPELLVLPLAVMLPLVEILLAAGLILNGLKSKIGLVMLLLLFIVILSYAIWLGLDIDCGCFGPEDPETEAFSGLRTALTRDLFILALLTWSIVTNRRVCPPRYHMVQECKRPAGDSR